MSKVQSPKSKIEEENDIQIVEGELLEVSDGGEVESFEEVKTKVAVRKEEKKISKTEDQKSKMD